MTALDFHHTFQRMNEPVLDFIARLEQVFQTGFGREQLSNETREMLLYGQLQEALLYTLMESPDVSGAQNYKELCLAAKREERRLSEQQYLKAEKPQISSSTNRASTMSQNRQRTYWRTGGYGNNSKTEKTGVQQQRQLRCYICDSPNHLARQCPQGKTEGSGRKLTQTKSSKSSGTRVICTGSHTCTNMSGASVLKL